MKKVNWKNFEIMDDDGDRDAVPALSAFFYFAAEVHDAAAELAEGIRLYLDFVGVEAITTYRANSGIRKPLTKRQLDKDLNLLRDFPADHKAIEIEYDSGAEGSVGDFGLYVNANENKEDFPKRMSVLRVDFPAPWLGGHDIEDFLSLVGEIVILQYVQSANVGLIMKTTSGTEGDAAPTVYSRLPRYLGFHPCDRHLRFKMLGHTFAAHWLNYIDDDLAASLGGPKGITKALPECDVRKLKKGLLIRGAKLPPIGDSNRKAPDLGCLPDVARLLKPTRLAVEETYFATRDENFDATAWIERMDSMDARPWDNSNAF